MIRLSNPGKAQRKCLIAKGIRPAEFRVTGPGTAKPDSASRATPLRMLCAVVRLDVLACGRGMRAWVWAAARGLRRPFDPPGGGSSAAGGREKRESLPPHTKYSPQPDNPACAIRLWRITETALRDARTLAARDPTWAATVQRLQVLCDLRRTQALKAIDAQLRHAAKLTKR